MAKRDSAELEATLEKLFDETCDSLVFVLDEVVVDGGAVEIRIGLDVPDEIGDAIQQHDFVRNRVKKLLEKARKALPDQTMSVALFPERLSETNADAWRRLEIALVKQEKAKPI